MTLKQKLRLSRLVYWIVRVRVRVLLTKVGSLHLAVPLACFATEVIVASAHRRTHRNVVNLNKAVAGFKLRYQAFSAEVRVVTMGGRQVGSTDRERLLASQSKFLAEYHRLSAACEEMKTLPLPTTAVVMSSMLTSMQSMCTSLQGRLARAQRKTHAFARILSQIETNPTYCWDLLLWFVIPSSYSEELLGDLTEEFEIRSAADGDIQARKWHRSQAIRTVGDHLWKNIERLAAIGTLVDLISKLFGK